MLQVLSLHKYSLWKRIHDHFEKNTFKSLQIPIKNLAQFLFYLIYLININNLSFNHKFLRF